MELVEHRSAALKIVTRKITRSVLKAFLKVIENFIFENLRNIETELFYYFVCIDVNLRFSN